MLPASRAGTPQTFQGASAGSPEGEQGPNGQGERRTGRCGRGAQGRVGGAPRHTQRPRPLREPENEHLLTLFCF